jgi:DNA-binding response OmpR family regulator
MRQDSPASGPASGIFGGASRRDNACLSRSARKALALVADDHGDSADIFSEALRQAGFAVEIAHSGRAALTYLEETTPHVVVLDLCLPQVDGVEILNHIRSSERLAGVYVIVISADPALAGTTLGQADRVLVKPIGFRWLRNLAVGLAEKLLTEDRAECDTRTMTD